MTDHTDDDFFDDAKAEFPDKEDLNNRLVAIFAIGPCGERQSKSTGKPYPYAGTVTVVLDDGPDGQSFTELVGPVGGVQPIALPDFQWSASGVYKRVKPRVGTELELRPMIGRINSKPNKTKGFTDSWSIAEPTDEDKALVRQFRVSLLKVRDDIIAAREAADNLQPTF